MLRVLLLQLPQARALPGVPEERCGGRRGERATSNAVVVRSDVQADELPTRSVVLSAPTSLSARPTLLRPEIDLLAEADRVLTEQVDAIDAGGRLPSPAGRGER
jgi:hypothetical protein